MLVGSAALAHGATTATVFPPANCSASELRVISWQDGTASTYCITGQDVLTLAIPRCSEGAYVARDGGQYLCKTVPTCGGTERLNFDGNSFMCEGTDGPPTCGGNQVLTFNGNRFICVNRTDTIPSCGANQFLTYNGSFQCAAITVPTLPHCAAGQVVTSNGNTLSCVDNDDVEIIYPTCADGKVLTYNGTRLICVTDATRGDKCEDIRDNVRTIIGVSGSNSATNAALQQVPNIAVDSRVFSLTRQRTQGYETYIFQCDRGSVRTIMRTTTPYAAEGGGGNDDEGVVSR